jgi:hypothetical protein
MGLFDDSDLISNRSFSWALGSFTAPPEDLEEFPEDVDRLSVFVTDDGVVNVDNQLLLYKEKDPIDAISDQTYSKGNKFIDGLEKALNTVPIYTTILYPAYSPIVNRGDTVFDRKPQGAPSGGWVPCAGQTLVYADNSRVLVPNLISVAVTSGAGDGAVTTTKYFAPPGMVYLIKVPEGWEGVVKSFFLGGAEADFDLNLRDLSEYAAPSNSLF